MHLISPVLGLTWLGVGAAAAFMLPLQLEAPLPSHKSRCLALQNTLHLENTTILNTTYLAFPTTVSTPGPCGSTEAQVRAAPLCRVQFVVNTTSTSSVRAEAWLPDVWWGRMLGLGNGNLEGCIDYTNLDYGTSLHFASISSDAGHSGPSAKPFLHHPELLNDFASRALHISAVIGKQIIHAYYATPAAHSYYLGCSQGGRQGTHAALRFPEDFDGIVAGAPGTDFNHLLLWLGILSRAVGAPMSPSAPDPKYLSPESWGVVSAEILRQCDSPDGLVDGIIAEPDECDFRAEALLCPPASAGDTMANANASNSTECLTPTQVESVKRIYTPLFGIDGRLVYPRYTPGAEADPRHRDIFGGDIFPLTLEWARYAILNDTNATLANLSIWDVPLWDSINPGGIATFDGDLSAFRNRGGKFLTYNGHRDPITPSTNAKRVYDLISRTLSLPNLDSFYRLFLIPGMGHCFGGIGAPSFGQSGGLNLVNDSAHNILLALVDWVEGGVAPDTIVGSGSDGATRTHCRYPMRSVWDGTAFVCAP